VQPRLRGEQLKTDRIWFRVSGYIPKVIDRDGKLTFPACIDCHKKLVQMPDQQKYSCEFCQKIVTQCEETYNFGLILMDFTNQCQVQVLGNEIGAAIMGHQASSQNISLPRFKPTSLLIRARAETYQNQHKVSYSAVKQFNVPGLDYPYSTDNCLLLQMLQSLK
jgi:hypothetical protein